MIIIVVIMIMMNLIIIRMKGFNENYGEVCCDYDYINSKGSDPIVFMVMMIILIM